MNSCTPESFSKLCNTDINCSGLMVRCSSIHLRCCYRKTLKTVTLEKIPGQWSPISTTLDIHCLFFTKRRAYEDNFTISVTAYAAFLWGDPNPRSVWIMVHQRNRRIHSGHGFAVPLMNYDPDRSWITDCQFV